MGARSCEGIVTRDLDQAGKERVARFARSAGKLGERMLAGWTRCELTAADNQAAKQQQPLVVFRQGTHQVRQEVECVRMRFQTLGRARRRVAATEHGGVNEKIGQERFAGRVRHGLQVSAWPHGEGLGGDGSIWARGVTGSLGVSGAAKPSMSRVEVRRPECRSVSCQRCSYEAPSLAAGALGGRRADDVSAKPSKVDFQLRRSKPFPLAPTYPPVDDLALVQGIADPTRPTSDGSEIGHHPLELRVRERSYERSHRDQVA